MNPNRSAEIMDLEKEVNVAWTKAMERSELLGEFAREIIEFRVTNDAGKVVGFMFGGFHLTDNEERMMRIVDYIKQAFHTSLRKTLMRPSQESTGIRSSHE